jgi:hypothetical protein
MSGTPAPGFTRTGATVVPFPVVRPEGICAAAARPSGPGRFLRRLAVAVAGAAVVVAGAVMLVLPGPGVVTIGLGLGLLGREFTWAARLNQALAARVRAAGRSVRAAVTGGGVDPVDPARPAHRGDVADVARPAHPTAVAGPAGPVCGRAA